MTEVLNGSTATLAYSETNSNLSVPLADNLAKLINIQGVKEVTVHNRPILLGIQEMEDFLNNAENALETEEDLVLLLEKMISPEDANKIYNHQVQSKITGRQFDITELGSITTDQTDELVLVLPNVKVNHTIVERVVKAGEEFLSDEFLTFLPPETEEEVKSPIQCLSGQVVRQFLNEMQDEQGGLDMNTQILVYAQLLTQMPDNDPSKMRGLFELRSLMQYADVVSNRNLRLAVTALVREEGEE